MAQPAAPERPADPDMERLQPAAFTLAMRALPALLRTDTIKLPVILALFQDWSEVDGCRRWEWEDELPRPILLDGLNLSERERGTLMTMAPMSMQFCTFAAKNAAQLQGQLPVLCELVKPRVHKLVIFDLTKLRAAFLQQHQHWQHVEQDVMDKYTAARARERLASNVLLGGIGAWLLGMGLLTMFMYS